MGPLVGHCLENLGYFLAQHLVTVTTTTAADHSKDECAENARRLSCLLAPAVQCYKTTFIAHGTNTVRLKVSFTLEIMQCVGVKIEKNPIDCNALH